MSERRTFNLACALDWAITPESLHQILEITAREHVPNFEAVETKRSRYMDNADIARQRDGVGILAITGPIFRRANMFTEFSGGASVTTLARDFHVLVNDPNVRAILLNVDSPGGEVNGVSEFAQMVFDARGKKPIVAYVGGWGASAAYWIASAADEIVADSTAMLGSIGVVAAVPNPDAKSARDIEFVSSQSPNKRPNPNTESGRTQIQSRIDDLASVFIEVVARNRAVSTETVQNDFGSGGVMVGAKAVEAGLADRLGSFEQTLSELAAGRWQRKPKTKPMTSAVITEEETMSLDEIKVAVKEAMASVMPAKPVATADDSTTKAELVEKEKQLAAAHAQLAEAKQVQFKADATAFVAAQVTANKLLPVEADQLTAQLTQAATDDAAHPLPEGSRVATIKATIEARPAHKLTEELVTDKGHKVLSPDGKDEGEISEKRQAELLKHTSVGQAALRAVK